MKPKKDYSILWISLKITAVVSVVIFVCCLMADAVSAPIQIMAGADTRQIKEASNATFLQSFGWGLFLFPLGVYLFGFILLKYLQYGNVFENGLLGLPYKRDFYGKLEYE